ncbi:MAG: hypothetical protein WKG07_17265 [Hymenobacter sp.]
MSLPSGTNYGIVVRQEGYLFHSENFDLPAGAAYAEVVKDIPLKKLEVGVVIVLNNIFFDTGKATLRPESTAELERLQALLSRPARHPARNGRPHRQRGQARRQPGPEPAPRPGRGRLPHHPRHCRRPPHRRRLRRHPPRNGQYYRRRPPAQPPHGV